VSIGTVVWALLAVGVRNAADMPITTATALWSLVGALFVMVLVALLGREATRQRILRHWSDDEDDEPRFRWLH
jgi:hypothetical protein